MRSFVLLAIALLATIATGQPNPGDWILSDASVSATGGLLRVNPTSGAFSLVYNVRPNGYFNGVMMGINNQDHAILWSGGPYHAAHVSPAGVLTTLGPVGMGPFSDSPNGIEADQDGNYVCTTAQSNGFYRIDSTTGASTSLLSVPGVNFGLTASTIDQDTGNYVFGFSTGGLFSMDRRTNVMTSIGGAGSSIGAVDFEPRTGDYVVVSPGNLFASSYVRRITRAGVTSTLLVGSVGQYNAVKVEDDTGNLLVAGSDNARLVDRTGAPIRTFTGLGGVYASGAEIYGSRKVAGAGPATPASTYAIYFSFPQSPGAVYVAALSLGLRPGIPMPPPDNRMLNLDFTSPLFGLSIGGIPGITTGFLGTLDPFGRASGSLLIPSPFTAGIRIFCAAVAVNPAFPTSLDLGNTWAFTTN